jgi:hypothetical protein
MPNAGGIDGECLTDWSFVFDVIPSEAAHTGSPLERGICEKKANAVLYFHQSLNDTKQVACSSLLKSQKQTHFEDRVSSHPVPFIVKTKPPWAALSR